MKNIFKGLSLGLMALLLVVAAVPSLAGATSTYALNAITETGALTITSTAGDLSLVSGDDVYINGGGVAASIGIGTDALEHAITIGNATDATGVSLLAGTDGIVLSTATGGLGLDVSTGSSPIGLGSSATTGTISIGNALSKTKITSGAVGTAMTDSTVDGSSWLLAVNPTGASGRYNALRVESLVASSNPVGDYAIRGLTGVAATYTSTGATPSYFAGVQGKLDFGGTMGGATGSIYATPVLAQVGANGSYGAATQLYGLWVDNQRATGGEGVFDMVNITNNGGVVDNVFKIYGNNNIGVFADIENLGAGAVVGAGTYSTSDGYLVIKVQGSTYRIPFFAAVD